MGRSHTDLKRIASTMGIYKTGPLSFGTWNPHRFFSKVSVEIVPVRLRLKP